MTIMINATWHDTYKFELVHHGTHESLGESDSQPRCQDLCPIIAQTTRIWDKLHNAAAWLIQTTVYKLDIDLHDYRT